MKRLLITHVADLDGAGPIILSKLVFNDIEFLSVDINEVDDTLKNNLDNYDIIYITDLNISSELAEFIEESDSKEKVKVFDHHHSNLDKNKYSFITVIDSLNGKKECGTSIYYKFLVDNFDNEKLHRNSLLKLIELTRQNDTWDFTDLKEEAMDLGSLYSIYGREEYISKFYNFVLKNEEFTFSDMDLVLLKIEKRKKDEYIKEKLENVKEAIIDKYKVGIVFAEKYRSSIGHELATKYDIGIIIDVDRSISYRADSNNNIDSSILAIKYGGGGHIKASGSPIPIDLEEKIIKYIFKDIKLLNIAK